MKTSDTITLHPAVTLALRQSETHCALASKATTEAERRAHLSTVRALNKAAMEMVKGNVPQTVGDGQYLVNSRTNAGVVYRVDVFALRCDCANQHACWHLAACNVLEEVATREANDGDLLPQGARDLLAETDGDLSHYTADDGYSEDDPGFAEVRRLPDAAMLSEDQDEADSSHYTEDDLTDEDYADFAELIEEI